MFVITSDVAGAEVTRSHLPRGLHSALRLEHATQQVRKILRKNIREKKILFQLAVKREERGAGEGGAGGGEGQHAQEVHQHGSDTERGGQDPA